MNNVFVYCEIEGTQVAEVSQELLTKGRKLANQLGVQLHAIVAGTGIKGKVEDQILPYGVDKLFIFDAEGLFPYTSAPHTDILVNLFKEEKPQICLMGATVIGRDLGPRVSSSLTSGLTADCTQLEIGSYDDNKTGKHYDNLLYQIRPAFGGNIVATIVNPDHRPQMATVRSGVMQNQILDPNYKGEVVVCDVAKYVPSTDYVVKVIDRHVEAAKHNLKGAPIVVAGGYGMGSKEGFDMLFELAKEIHGEVGQVLKHDGAVLGCQCAYGLQFFFVEAHPRWVVGVAVDDGGDVAFFQVAFDFRPQLVATEVVYVETLILCSHDLALLFLHGKARVDEQDGIFLLVGLR